MVNLPRRPGTLLRARTALESAARKIRIDGPILEEVAEELFERSA